MFKWLPYALVRITFFYVVGVLFATYHPDIFSAGETVKIALSLCILYFLCWLILLKASFRRFNLLLSILAFTAVFFVGHLNLKYCTERLDPSHIIHNENIRQYSATVVESQYETSKTFRYKLEVTAIKDSVWKETSGQVYLYIAKTHLPVYKLGEQLLINDSPQPLRPPMNPNEFNYRRFLSFKNIHHQNYSKGSTVVLIGQQRVNPILKLTNDIRMWAAEVLKTAVPQEREQQIALALILGVKDGLTNEIKNAYSASGAMHVLAVSGLHVGIIYGIVLLVFGRLNKSAKTRWILGVISIILLWAYAGVTGLSPSVMRAATMFSFVAVARATGRSTNIYNTIAGSGLLLLLIGPYLIMSVGFQLSYLAVLGIIYFQPKVYHLIYVNNQWLDKIWVITSVSIAAQLSTFTLGLLYFHQFPTYFLFSNLIVIPGAFLILVLGISVLLFSFSGILLKLLSSILTGVILFVNEAVYYIEGLPNSIVEGIYLTTIEAWCIMGMILCFFFYIDYRKRVYLAFVKIGALVFFSIRIQWINNEVDQQSITFYKVNNHMAIDIIDRGKSVLITDSALWNDFDKKRFHIKPHHLKSGITDHNFISSTKEKPYEIYAVLGKNILVVNRSLKEWEIDKSTYFDYVLIGHSYNSSLKVLNEKVKYNTLIIDGSMKGYMANRLLQEAEELKLNYYSVYHNGAKTIKI